MNGVLYWIDEVDFEMKTYHYFAQCKAQKSSSITVRLKNAYLTKQVLREPANKAIHCPHRFQRKKPGVARLKTILISSSHV